MNKKQSVLREKLESQAVLTPEQEFIFKGEF